MVIVLTAPFLDYGNVVGFASYVVRVLFELILTPSQQLLPAHQGRVTCEVRVEGRVWLVGCRGAELACRKVD